MNSFNTTRLIEAQSLAILEPFLQARENVRGYVLVDKGPLAKRLQETVGDLLMNCGPSGRLTSVEIKAEESNKYGRLFLECWSNLNLDDADEWEARGSNPGWAWKLHPGLLFYHFVKDDELYIFQGHKLWKWMHDPRERNLNEYPPRAQSKYSQKNDTWGHCVPIDVLRANPGFKFIRPRQFLEFRGEAA